MKGKGERMTYWLIGEDPAMREIRSKERSSRRIGNCSLTKKAITMDPLVPRSSLKNKALTRTTFLRCSSESPKRLRFASSDQLDKKSIINGSQLESIADNSPCKGKVTCPGRSSQVESMISSNSCPCVEKLCDAETFPVNIEGLPKTKIANENFGNSAPMLRNDTYLDNQDSTCTSLETKGFWLGASDYLRIACKSAPNSPKNSSAFLNAQQRRGTRSTDEIDSWDVDPLI